MMGLKRRFGGTAIRAEGPGPGGGNSETAYMDEGTFPLDEGQVLEQTDPEEKAKTEKYVMQAHRACGHTTSRELARALSARG